ncbi:MAG: ECF transporter S component [Clostridiales bacterium]|nr:ECF transporter S component [Clostridiales bacterium]
MKNVFSATRLTRLALFVALTLLLGLTPLGLIRLGPLNLTLLFLPVVAGTLSLGLLEGLVLGACFGAISAASAFGASPSVLASMTVSASPFWALVMCFVPRLLIPVNVHLVHRALSGGDRPRRFALPVAAAAGTLTNTVFYLGTMLLIFVAAGLDTGRVLAVIFGFGGVGAICETLLCAAVIPPIVLALRKIDKKNKG